MHEIDRSFRVKRVAAEEKRARTLRNRILAAGFGTVAIGLIGGGFVVGQYWAPDQETPITEEGTATADVAPPAAAAPAAPEPKPAPGAPPPEFFFRKRPQ